MYMYIFVDTLQAYIPLYRLILGNAERTGWPAMRPQQATVYAICISWRGFSETTTRKSSTTKAIKGIKIPKHVLDQRLMKQMEFGKINFLNFK